MYICVVGEKEYGIKIDPGNLLSRNIVYSRNLLSVRENIKGFPGALVINNLPANAGHVKRRV